MVSTTSDLRGLLTDLLGSPGSNTQSTILVIIYHLLQRGSEYEELGGDFFQRTEREVLQQRYARVLKRLGYQVTLTPARATAN